MCTTFWICRVQRWEDDRTSSRISRDFTGSDSLETRGFKESDPVRSRQFDSVTVGIGPDHSNTTWLRTS